MRAVAFSFALLSIAAGAAGQDANTVDQATLDRAYANLRAKQAAAATQPAAAKPVASGSASRGPASQDSWKVWEAQQAQIDPDHRPYELKGDRLGMTLDMFKRKYYRIVPDDL